MVHASALSMKLDHSLIVGLLLYFRTVFDFDQMQKIITRTPKVLGMQYGYGYSPYLLY